MYRKKGKHTGVVCRFIVVFVKGGKVKKGRIITDGETIREILLKYHTVAILGLSPQPERDSHMDKCIKVEHARLCKAPSC